MNRIWLGAFAALAFSSCQPKLPTSENREVASMVVVLDASTSSGATSQAALSDLRCPEVTASIRQALNGTAKRVDALVLATGGTPTASEPRVLVPWMRYQRTARLFGVTASRQNQEQAFISKVEEVCRAKLQPEGTSPIVAAISRGALSLTSHCQELSQRREVCTSRQLAVFSDLRENVDVRLKQRLLLVSRMMERGKPLPPSLGGAPLIAVGSMAVSVCGLGEHSEGKDDVRVLPDAVVTVWRDFLPGATYSAACQGESVRIAKLPSAPGGPR